MKNTETVNVPETQAPERPRSELANYRSLTKPPGLTKDRRDGKPLENTFSGLLLFLLGSGVVLLLVLWPWTFGSKSALQAPETREYLGVLKEIKFVGGFRTDTQIQTENRTLLVERVVNFKKGVILETRVDFFGQEVCEVGTDECHSFAGSLK
jgi:hypothetical protein